MDRMTARQPRPRRRRVTTPAASLPRPVAGTGEDGQSAARPLRRAAAAAPGHHREHHVTRDYSHVKRDLATIGVVATITTGFIVAMWAII